MSTLPMCAERGMTAIGTSAPNSRRGESGRIYLQSRLPRGADPEIALESARSVARVYAEIEGRGAALSLDVALAAARHLDLESRLRLAGYWLSPLGLHVSAEAEPMGEPR